MGELSELLGRHRLSEHVAEVILWFLMSPILGLLVLIFGLIPALFVILVVRMGLEVSMATVRTAIDVRAL